MSGGRQRAGACQCLVHGTHVDARCGHLSVLFWLQPDDGHFGEQFFRTRLAEYVQRVIPAGTFDEQAANVASIGWSLSYVFRRLFHDLDETRREVRSIMTINIAYLEAEADGVDGYAMSASKILKGARQKGLRKEEATDPEDTRYAMIDPRLDEFNALD